MTPAFAVRTTPHFERLAQRLLKKHPDFREILVRAREILQTDPYNRARSYHIKKLEDVKQGDGQYRLSLGRFRFRYDIYGREVVLQYCGLRREDSYR